MNRAKAPPPRRDPPLGGFHPPPTILPESQGFLEGHETILTAVDRGEFARLVLRLRELDGKLDGLCNDLKILRHVVWAAKEQAKKHNYQAVSRPVRTLDKVIAFLFWFTAIPAFIVGLLWLVYS